MRPGRRKLLISAGVVPFAVLLGAAAGCDDGTSQRGDGASDGGPGVADAGAAHPEATTDAPDDTGGDPRDGASVDVTTMGCTTATATSVSFRKITLHRDFTCEGATIADIDGDGQMDVVAGPQWWQGPDFARSKEIWPRMTFDPHSYSNCFFQFARDLDGDGRTDIVMVGFPGQGAAWFRNDRDALFYDYVWPRYAIADFVDGESPAFTDVTGDGVPELVFMNGGRLGWAAPDPTDPTNPWTFHPLSDNRGYGTFTHGMGVGDLDGDGRVDVVEASGYFLQPTTLLGDPLWARREQSFGSGGAQMLVTDVDGDGDADVITSLVAHGYGLAWNEQLAPATAATAAATQPAPSFAQHIIVPDAEPAPDAEVVLHEPHALAMADVDGDGTMDVVTGERFWGHVPAGDPDFHTPARLYWFQRRHDDAGPCFVPRLIDADSGVGTQVTTGDVNGDGRVDIVVANKKGAFVFIQNAP